MEISENVIEILDYICEKLGLAIDWSNVNVIPYIKEICGKIVNYEICTSVVWIGIALLLTVFAIFVIIRSIKDTDKTGDDNSPIFGFMFFIILIMIIIIIFQTFDIIECIMFPEKQIMEYFLGVLKELENI